MLVPALSSPAAASTLAGDVDGNQVVEARDLAVLLSRIFDATIPAAPGADVNQDQQINVADVVALMYALAGVSPPPTNTLVPPTLTATATPTRTITATLSPTATSTPTPSPTPTACSAQSITPGSVTGSLTPGDCPDAGNAGRPSHLYRVAANPGQAMKVDVTADGFTPLVTISDPGVYFQRANAPVEFLVTTARSYEIVVGSTGPTMTGNYSLAVTVRNCPTVFPPVVPTATGTTRSATLLDNDCPDPVEPGTPAHLFTFAAQAGTPVQIDMVVNPTSFDLLPDPFLSLYGPTPTGAFTGYFMAADDSTGGFNDNGTSNATLFFYPIESGTYTVVASGAGSSGPYSITFSLPACASRAATVSATPMQFDSTLNETSCPAPVPPPDPNFAGLPPDADTRADVWTVSLNAGDVLGAKLSTVDLFDTQLYLLDPDHALLATDSGGSEDGPPDSQLAYTAPRNGTYTLIAASTDAAATQDGASAAYALELQRCPARPLAVDTPTAESFVAADCRGSGGAHMNSYRVDAAGIAGQFVTITMVQNDAALDPVLALTDPNGVRLDNDDDPFLSTKDARVSRVLTPGGAYFVTASSFSSNGPVEAAFTLWAQRCRTIPIPETGGMASGQFQDDDCSLFQSGATSAPKVNVFTVANHANQMVSVMPPAVGCALAVTADGLQGPGTECLGDYFAMPLVTAGTTAVMVAARDGATRGSYSFPVSVCPAGLLNYHSDIQPGTISGGDCHDATGVPADFYIVRLPRWLAMYNDGWSGHLVDVEFSHSAVSADGSGMAPLPDLFSTSIDDLWLLGLDVASAIVIRPTSTSGVGTYAIEVAPAIFHQ